MGLFGLGDKKREHPLVLHVDDSRFVLTVVKTMLLTLGCEVIGALSGKECLKSARANKPDVILLDTVMPEMDGVQTVTELKQDSATKDIPIIMLTGISIMRDVELALAAGAQGYLVKPVDINQLRIKLAKFIPVLP